MALDALALKDLGLPPAPVPPKPLITGGQIYEPWGWREAAGRVWWSFQLDIEGGYTSLPLRIPVQCKRRGNFLFKPIHLEAALALIEKTRAQPSRTGRKRKVPVTLPDVGGYDEADIEPLPSDVAGPVVEEAFDGLFADIEKAGTRKGSLKAQSDPLGLATGAYARRPPDCEGSPTPERLAKAAARGVTTKTVQHYTKSGIPKGNGHQRFVGFLAMRVSRGELELGEELAARKYQTAVVMARRAEPSLMGRYEHFIAASTRSLEPSEVALHYKRELALAWASVTPRLQPFLSMIASDVFNDVSLDYLAEQFYPNLKLATAKSKMLGFLQLTCASLCDFYGLPHRWGEHLTKRHIDKLFIKEG